MPLRQPLAEVLASGNHYLPTGYDHVVTLRVGREDRHYLPRILAVGDALTGFGGAAILLQDVTKFRLLDDAKNNLVGTVSHELKTPLTGLRMAVYLLLEQNLGQLTAAQRELLETARDDTDRLLRILNDLLDLSRLEGGATALNRTPERVDGLLAAMIGEIRPLIEAAGQRIEVNNGVRGRHRAGRSGPHPACVHQPAHQRQQVFARGQRDHPLRRAGSRRLREVRGARPRTGHSAGEPASRVREVLSRPGADQEGCGPRAGHRPRDRGGARRLHRLCQRAGPGQRLSLPPAGRHAFFWMTCGAASIWPRVTPS